MYITNSVQLALTADQTFVVARFLQAGILDPLFNISGTVPGIAYSDPVNVLNYFGSHLVCGSCVKRS